MLVFCLPFHLVSTRFRFCWSFHSFFLLSFFLFFLFLFHSLLFSRCVWRFYSGEISSNTMVVVRFTTIAGKASRNSRACTTIKCPLILFLLLSWITRKKCLTFVFFFYVRRKKNWTKLNFLKLQRKASLSFSLMVNQAFKFLILSPN